MVELTGATRRGCRARQLAESGDRFRVDVILDAILAVVCAVASWVADSFTPEVRHPVCEPGRLQQDDRTDDLRVRGCMDPFEVLYGSLELHPPYENKILVLNLSLIHI